ncbi:MAG: DUF4189 domain-containing protein [Hyphomicrobiaceae bacterium]|nr:DUF4189 domain-containing protein [Hyphomicrobiaceae bacterium]
MLNAKSIALTVLSAVCAALACAHLSVPAAAQSLEDALRRAERGNTPPPSSQPAPPPATGKRARKWGALAAGLWRSRGYGRVAVGSVINASSEEEARRDALRQCRNAGGRNCKVTTSFNTGCGYIAIGTRGRVAGWVVRQSLDEARRACRAKRYRCKKPIGGCVT